MSSSPSIELVGLTKAFGACVANDGVTLAVRPGTIHGIVGENGAGKSTAMKMLYGMYAPDAGEIRIDGTVRRWASPSDAIAAGIGMVHQHFMLAGPYTALENVLLGAEPSTSATSWIPRWLRPIDRAGARRKLEALSKQYKLPVDWDAPVEELPVGIQQRIEILKLLYRDARIMILDEPTAVLTPQETQDLFTQLRKLRDEGKTILIITHKLKEVMSFTDRVTVFRAGRVTGEVETSQTNPQQLADLMVGRKVVLSVDVPPKPEKFATAAPVFEARGLSLQSVHAPHAEGDRARGHGYEARHRLQALSFKVMPGEIVGIAGVEGNGQSELLQAILHPAEPECRSAGEVRVLDQDVSTWDAFTIRELGVGVIPEDRHHEAILLERPLTENFLLGLHRSPRFQRRGIIRERELGQVTRRAMEEYDVRPRETSTAAGRLSGGNQQKLVIAREFSRDPKFLVAAQPTRGVDVGAIEFIHQRIVRARQEGAGVLLVSSELDEILTLSDRILVMYEGAVVAEYARGQCDERELGLRMGGVTS